MKTKLSDQVRLNDGALVEKPLLVLVMMTLERLKQMPEEPFALRELLKKVEGPGYDLPGYMGFVLQDSELLDHGRIPSGVASIIRSAVRDRETHMDLVPPQSPIPEWSPAVLTDGAQVNGQWLGTVMIVLKGLESMKDNIGKKALSEKALSELRRKACVPNSEFSSEVIAMLPRGLIQDDGSLHEQTAQDYLTLALKEHNGGISVVNPKDIQATHSAEQALRTNALK